MEKENKDVSITGDIVSNKKFEKMVDEIKAKTVKKIVKKAAKEIVKKINKDIINNIEKSNPLVDRDIQVREDTITKISNPLADKDLKDPNVLQHVAYTSAREMNRAARGKLKPKQHARGR